jgi:hypothetical protein
MRSRCGALGRLVIALLSLSGPALADDEPTRWEQLFFPFPIVGAPPQLEQQVQLFASGFTGREGGGFVPSVEVAFIATPHLAFVATVPYQLGFGGQRWGFGDAQLLAQYLAGGSLRLDDMVSVGLQVTLPTAQNGLGSGDFFFGPFAYAAQRFWHHVIVELNVTALIPIMHGDTARQFLINGLLSALVTPRRSRVPLYVQVEVDTATYVDGTGGLPPMQTSSPAETVFVAPELFVGPVHGVRVAGGVFFNAYGDPVHAVTYSLTCAVDIPNRFGY